MDPAVGRIARRQLGRLSKKRLSLVPLALLEVIRRVGATQSGKWCVLCVPDFNWNNQWCGSGRWASHLQPPGPGMRWERCLRHPHQGPRWSLCDHYCSRSSHTQKSVILPAVTKAQQAGRPKQGPWLYFFLLILLRLCEQTLYLEQFGTQVGWASYHW